MKASVIICTYNRKKLLLESIRSIQRQDFPSDLFEIIVVDNNSNDGTREAVAELAASSPAVLEYVFENRQGLSFARNTGIKCAKGEIIVFTDDDVGAESQWLGAMVSAFSEPDVYGAGGPLRPVWPIERPAWLTDEFLSPLAISEFKPAHAAGEFKGPLFPWGANMAFRKEVFQSIGLFPENLGRVGNSLLSNEELEISYRIIESGKRIRFAPEAVIHHKIAAGRLRKRWFYRRYYLQGRSDAVLHSNMKRCEYGQLRSYGAALIARAAAGRSGFAARCYNRLAKGYLHQLVSQENAFKRLRAVDTFVSEIVKSSVKARSNRNGAPVVTAENYDERYLINMDALRREKDELIKIMAQLLHEKELRIIDLTGSMPVNEVNAVDEKLRKRDERISELVRMLIEKDGKLAELSVKVERQSARQSEPAYYDRDALMAEQQVFIDAVRKTLFFRVYDRYLRPIKKWL